MTPRHRLLVLVVSVPLMAFAVVGGALGRSANASEQGTESFRALRIFQDVVALILDNYVEEVDIDHVMHGALRGLADGLDADSAYLTAAQATAAARGGAAPAHTGLTLTRQYYLRVIAARDGSPAARAGLRPGDYIRAIGGEPTRDLSVLDGQQRLSGAVGSTVTVTVLRGSAAEPHEVTLTREALGPLPVRGRVAQPGTGVLRIAEFSAATSKELRSEAAALTRAGAARLVLDLRGASGGDLDLGFEAARLFVSSGVLGYRQSRGADKQPVSSASGDGALTVPVVVLIDSGSSGPAEILAAALQGTRRGRVVGERTIGRTARQRLVSLPAGDALMLTHLMYLAPGGGAIHGKGIVPDVAVDRVEVEFGDTPPPGDPALDAALQAFESAARPAA